MSIYCAGRRVGASAIKIEDNHIVIRIPDNDFNEVYDTPPSDLVDAAGIVEWIFLSAENNGLTAISA